MIPGPDGWPEGYEYTAGGQSIRFMDEVLPGVRPILHMRLFHPVNDHYGMSPIEAAAMAIDIHNEASKWNKALLDNSAQALAARWSTPAHDGQMTAEQFERLKSELEASYQSTKQRRPADAARRRARLEAVVAQPQGHGLHRGEEHSFDCALRLSFVEPAARRGIGPARSRWRSVCRRCCSVCFLALSPARRGGDVPDRRREARGGGVFTGAPSLTARQ